MDTILAIIERYITHQKVAYIKIKIDTTEDTLM